MSRYEHDDPQYETSRVADELERIVSRLDSLVEVLTPAPQPAPADPPTRFVVTQHEVLSRSPYEVAGHCAPVQEPTRDLMWLFRGDPYRWTCLVFEGNPYEKGSTVLFYRGGRGPQWDDEQGLRGIVGHTHEGRQDHLMRRFTAEFFVWP